MIVSFILSKPCGIFNAFAVFNSIRINSYSVRIHVDFCAWPLQYAHLLRTMLNFTPVSQTRIEPLCNYSSVKCKYIVAYDILFLCTIQRQQLVPLVQIRFVCIYFI